jgi:putative toxin-antitoxin system antitoxin component (TIGR02293 family)
MGARPAEATRLRLVGNMPIVWRQVAEGSIMATSDSPSRVVPGSEHPTRSRVQRASDKLGGKKLLGVEVRAEADLVQVVKLGIPVDALMELARQQALSPDEVDRLIIRARTLSHRKAKAQPLSQVESERALRLASIAALAEETFADPDKAKRWLRRPTAALQDMPPLDLLESEPGARLVEQLLHRIAHGIAA